MLQLQQILEIHPRTKQTLIPDLKLNVIFYRILVLDTRTRQKNEHASDVLFLHRAETTEILGRIENFQTGTTDFLPRGISSTRKRINKKSLPSSRKIFSPKIIPTF